MANMFGFGTTGTPVSLIVATTLTESANGGKLGLLNLAAGFTATLPASTGNGAVYRFLVQTVSTTGYVIKVANTTDIMTGTVYTLSDGAAAVLGYTTGATDDTITLNGTTKGGVAVGDWIELVDYAAGFFGVRGLTVSSGTEATPFSATV